MKIRAGFVSNSSSSSFTIVSKEELTKELLLQSLKIDQEHPLNNLFEGIVDCVLARANPINKEQLKCDVEEYGYEEERDLLKLSEDNYVYTGRFSDQGYDHSAEYFLCTNGINVEVEGLKIICEGGY